MAQRRVFGKRSQTQRDTFASMLYSSPADKPTTTSLEPSKKEESAIEGRAVSRSTPQQKKQSILQPVSGNVGRSNREKLSAKAVPTSQKAEDAITRPPNSKEHSTDLTLPSQQSVKQSRSCKPSRKLQDPTTTPKIPTDAHKHAGLAPKEKHFDDAIYSRHCISLLDVCEQTIEDFSTWSSKLTEHLNLAKIAEASYGEVYRLTMNGLPDGQEIHDESVLKVIALTPPDCTLPTTKAARAKAVKRASLMSKPHDVACEVRLLQRMSTIPGFTDFREMTILKGRPPPAFVSAYKAYNKAQSAAGKEVSTFPDPAKKSSYPHDQLWAVIEMRDAGTDLERLLEHGQCQDISSVWDIFWQVALALAKGEEAAQFEHRDLHLGNICLKRTQRKRRSRKLHYTDLDVTLIDYTISRAAIDNGVAYMDLSRDEHLFVADSTYEYQYDIYRYMRSALYHDDPLAAFDDTDTSRSWVQYHPQTNLVWLHFVLYMLLDQTVATTKQDKKLSRILVKVSELLDPELVIKNGLTSTGILIATALNNGWLDEQDIVGTEESLILDELVDNFAALSA